MLLLPFRNQGPAHRTAPMIIAEKKLKRIALSFIQTTIVRKKNLHKLFSSHTQRSLPRSPCHYHS